LETISYIKKKRKINAGGFEKSGIRESAIIIKDALKKSICPYRHCRHNRVPLRAADVRRRVGEGEILQRVTGCLNRAGRPGRQRAVQRRLPLQRQQLFWTEKL